MSSSGLSFKADQCVILDQDGFRVKAGSGEQVYLNLLGMEWGVRDTEDVPQTLRPMPKALLTKCYPIRRGRPTPSGVEFVGR